MDKREIRNNYHNMIQDYAFKMIDCDNLSKVLLLLSQKAVPFIETQGWMNKNILRSKCSKKELEILQLPISYEVNLKQFNKFTIADIEFIKKEQQNMDEERKELHKKLLKYAHKYYAKDYLDVYIDILAEVEHWKNPNELKLRFNSSKDSIGNLTWRVGLLTTPRSWGMEFTRFYGDSSEDETINESIKESYEYLEMMRKEERKDPQFKKVYYSSEIGKNRTEEEDNNLIEKIKKEFSENIAFAGDYVFKLMHGRYLFGKYMEFDLNREKEDHSELALKVEKIKDKICSLLEY